MNLPEQCGAALRLADDDHPRTGIPIDCTLTRNHDGEHYGETSTPPLVAVSWAVR